MLDFFRKLRGEGRLVFLCVHPNEQFHLEILEEICERFIFVHNGRLTQAASFDELIGLEPARAYLGNLLTEDAA
jgi:ABC-type multidrug transport system ATPase subunit